MNKETENVELVEEVVAEEVQAGEQEMQIEAKPEAEIKFHDVSEQLNVYNSELGYLFPNYKVSQNVIEYNPVDYNKLDYYSKEMNKLQAKFDNLVANSAKYNDGYAEVVIDEIKAEASKLAEVAEQELDAVFEDVKSNPRVIEAFDYSVDREANAINRNTAVIMAKSILESNDLGMIKGLLADNISNDDIRLLAKIKLQQLNNNSNDYKDRLPVATLLNAIDDFEAGVKKQSELGKIAEQHELSKGAFKIAKQSNKFLARVKDLNKEEFQVETVEFSMNRYKQEARK